MQNIDFYTTAATVIPLLLIAVMASRSLRSGELQTQPASTVLIFGLPVIGELAAFAFLFFRPVPNAAAAALAVVTWLGLLSQLGVASWWLAELIRGAEAQRLARTRDVQAESERADEDSTVIAEFVQSSLPRPAGNCPTCGGAGFTGRDRRISCPLCGGEGHV
jgi:hypothetical protein